MRRLGPMPRWLRRRRTWLAAGVPVAGLVAMSALMSVSLSPPSARPRHTSYALATTELSITSASSSGDAPELSTLYPLPTWAAVLAEEMTSPRLRSLTARAAKIASGDLAIDGPIAANLQRTQQEPTGEKRSTQIVSERDPYRITLDTDPNLAGIAITARAPTQAGAVRLAAAAEQAVRGYLRASEVHAGVPVGDRVHVGPLVPVVIRGGAGGHSLAGLLFAVTYALWAGLVCLVAKLARDMRTLRHARAPRKSDRLRGVSA